MADSSTPEILNTYARKLVQIKARQLCQRRGFSPSDCEDLEQDMLLHLLEQSHKFDPDRASLPTFISRVVDSHVAMILRGQRCKKRAAGIMALSLQPMLISAARRPEKQRSCLKNGELYHLSKATHTEMDAREFQEAVEALPADLQEIVNRLTEAPATKVARDLGISRRQMSYAINSIRRHLSIAGIPKKMILADTATKNGICKEKVICSYKHERRTDARRPTEPRNRPEGSRDSRSSPSMVFPSP